MCYCTEHIVEDPRLVIVGLRLVHAKELINNRFAKDPHLHELCKLVMAKGEAHIQWRVQEMSRGVSEFTGLERMDWTTGLDYWTGVLEHCSLGTGA